MTTLLVDAGNTRIKWAYLRAGRIGPQSALAHRIIHGRTGKRAAVPLVARDWDALARRWRKAMQRRRDPLREVWVVSVAGARFDAALRTFFRRLGLRVHFAASARVAGGVRNGYRDAWRLGADRWVALLGARALLPRRAACVVDAGTAITIDLLDADGRHRGGAIVPGPQLMVQSLLRGTSGIRRRAASAQRGGTTLFARNTQAGLQAGAQHAAAAIIERASNEARGVLGARPVMLLTGGAAPPTRSLHGVQARAVPDLVLRGLAVLAAR